MTVRAEASIDDLYAVRGKAELVNGEIVHMSPTGDDPSTAAGANYVSLHACAKRTQRGRAYPDNVGFLVRGSTLRRRRTRPVSTGEGMLRRRSRPCRAGSFQ